MILDPEKIVTMPLEEMWNYFKRMKNHFKHGVFEDTYKKSRYGHKIKFELDDFINGNLAEKPKKGIVRIRNKWYELSEIYSELEERERTLTDYLLLNYEEGDIVE